MGLKGAALRTYPRKSKADARSKRTKQLEVREDNLANSLTGIETDSLIVSGQTTATSTLAKSTEDTGMTEHSTKETLGQLTLIPYQNTTSSVRDFLARISALLEDGQESKELEAHCSVRYAECYGLRNLAMFSLRTSKDCSLPTMGERLESSSLAWMNWGMTVNGRCLTARISECHRTGNGCSLSDILEDNPDQKYFLSERLTQYIQNQMDKSATPLTAIITKDGLTTDKGQ